MRSVVTKRLAEELKTIRTIRKLSLRVVEKETGISNAYLSQLERGEAENPSPDKLQKLARYYGVPYENSYEGGGLFKARVRERESARSEPSPNGLDGSKTN